jgi:hypothetical protein
VGTPLESDLQDRIILLWPSFAGGHLGERFGCM